MAVLHEGQELALAEQGVGEVEAVEFDLLRMIDAEGFDVPIVERAVIFEFQGADGVGDAFDGIALAVGVVVHGVDAPLVAGAVMLGVEDAVHDGVAQVEVGRRHVDFGAEGAGAIGELAGLHAGEEVEILFDGAIAVRAFGAGFGGGAAVLADLVGGEIADVGLAVFDELHGPVVELAEIIGGVEEAAFPIEAEPVDVVDDGIDVFRLFLAGVGVVEAQVGFAAELRGQAEIEADGLGVADVQVAVGLRREPRVYPSLILVGLQVVENDVANEIGRAACQLGV